MQGLIEAQYLPSIEYFCALLTVEHIVVEKYEHYTKQSYRNRCYINTANGVVKLIIPIVGKPDKTLMRDTRIAYQSRWQHIHWKTIESAYRRAPFFDHYADELRSILFYDYDYLYDLNKQLLSFCLRSLNFPISVSESRVYVNKTDDSTYDFRSIINTKKPYYGRAFYRSFPYLQVFGSVFMPNLSILDVLFCEGTHSMHIINSSADFSCHTS